VNWIDAYDQKLHSVLITNALIFSVVNIILMTILEALIFFNDSKESKIKAENLEKELSQIKFEVLKNQINPHFMFNSLNVLSGLIENDVAKAQQFIDEFSMIYRYVLETIEKPVVSLNEELGFVRSYIFLQQIRYGEDLLMEVNIPAHLLNLYLPPLSLQIVLENAIKHNVISTSKPLKIEIFHDQSWLSVRNNIQAKISSAYSSGLGQKNMIKRYSMISDKIPEFIVEATHYLVKLPLLENE
jgi:LytS/YehU family sensor histidine kinase